MFTDDVAPFAERVWSLLAADPVRNTISLTVIDTLRRDGTGRRRFSADPMLFGWYDEPVGAMPDDEARPRGVTGAIFMTPPFELLLREVPDRGMSW